MVNPAKQPRKLLKRTDPSFEETSKRIKQKVAALYKEFGADPLNKKILRDLQKEVEKYINALAPYDPAIYALLEAQWVKLTHDYQNYLKDPKNPEFSTYLSDAFLVFKTEVDNI